MKLHIINGELSVHKVKVKAMTSASTFFVGDTKRVSLSTIFESPPEELIVGVTTGQVQQRTNKERKDFS